MIIITGAAGFIGSCLLSKLNQEGFKDIILVDDFSDAKKNKNLEDKKYSDQIHRDDFFIWLDNNAKQVQFVFHMGARTDTTETDKSIFDKLNLNYSKEVWERCAKYNLPLIYASSAATYGRGEHGYGDDHQLIPRLKPLNLYSQSKQVFDEWMLNENKRPPFYAGLKFFNVYGPNEYHKGRMASVIFHAYHQIKENGKVRLFKSHNPDYEHGKQLRDFIYVKDVVDIMYHLMKHKKDSGIYNIGTGVARTFSDLAHAVFKAMKLKPYIHFIDTPKDIRDKYQYFTEAKMNKLWGIYNSPFHSLEQGISDYVLNYLSKEILLNN